MSNKKKVYTIRITGSESRPGIWYSDRVGGEFEAELKLRPGTSVIVFQVTQSQFVYPMDCEVIGERIEELYSKPA
jgi:hypothetical protein